MWWFSPIVGSGGMFNIADRSRYADVNPVLFLWLPETRTAFQFTLADESTADAIQERFVKAIRLTAVPAEKMSDFEYQTGLRDRVDAEYRALREELMELLNESQCRLLAVRLAYFHSQVGLFGPEDAEKRLRMGQELIGPASDFWSRVEEPSRQARANAIEAILAILDKEQRKKLVDLVGEEMLTGSFYRNDHLYAQLIREIEADEVGGGPDEYLQQLRLSLTFHLLPDGNVAPRLQVAKKLSPTKLIAALIQPANPSGFASRLLLTDGQTDELVAIEEELARVEERLIEQARMNSASQYYFEMPEYLNSRQKAWDQILNAVLLPHQVEAMELELAVNDLAQRGLAYGLTEGKLGKYIQLGKKQRDRIHEIVPQVAEKLREESWVVYKDAIQLVEPWLEQKQQLNLLKDYKPERFVCPAPEAIIPLQSGRFGTSTFRNFYQLRVEMEIDKK